MVEKYNDMEKEIVRWWIVPQQKHFGYLTEGQQVSSNFDIEYFSDEQNWLKRLEELDISTNNF